MTMTGALPPALPDSERQSGADLAEALRGVRIVWLHGCVPRNPLRASRHHAVEKPVWRAAKRTGALEAQSEGEKSVHLGEMTRVVQDSIDKSCWFGNRQRFCPHWTTSAHHGGECHHGYRVGFSQRRRNC